MRGLAVFYCSECGFYGYYQAPQNAVCPLCKVSMTELKMTYRSFMRLEYQSRDKLIADQIAGEVTPYTSVVQRITEPEKSCRQRSATLELKLKYVQLERKSCEQGEMIERLQEKNCELIQKNQEQEATIQWMHDMIWDLTRKLHNQDMS